VPDNSERKQELIKTTKSLVEHLVLGDAIHRINELSDDYGASADLMTINGFNDIERATEESFWSF